MKYTGPMRFAHRGFVQGGPENTPDAFQAAADFGTEGIEIDVHRTKDNKVIVNHDDDLASITYGTDTQTGALINDLNADEILALPVLYKYHIWPKEPTLEGEDADNNRARKILHGELPDSTPMDMQDKVTRLMSFADFEKWMDSKESNNIIAEVEIKDLGCVDKILDILKDSQNASRYILFSGIPAIVDEIQAVCRERGKPKGLRLGANIRFLTDETKALVEKSDFWEVGLNAEYTEDDVAWLNSRGVEVFSNLGDYPSWWKKMTSMNTRGFKTNFPEAFTEWWNKNK